MHEVNGVFVPVPTPYRGDVVAAAWLQANLAAWNETGVDGYALLGSTGECSFLSEAERDLVLVAAREAIPRDRLMIAAAGADSTAHAIRQARRAAEIGADVASVLTPHGYPRALSQPSAQIRHYLAVADASPIPILVHHAPADTGVTLAPDTVARIAEHPNVCGIEDASGDLPQDAQIVHLTSKTFHVLVTAASALLPSLAIGSSGGVLALAAIAPREYVSIYRLARQARWDEARDVAGRMILAERGVLGKHGVGGLKAAMDLQGLYGGPCRAPLGTPDGDAVLDIKESLVSAGLL